MIGLMLKGTNDSLIVRYGFSSYHVITRIVACVARESFLICDKDSNLIGAIKN